MKNFNFILTALTSAIGGAVIGILFAPDKGKRTREKISRETDEYLKSLKEDVEEMREYLENKVEETSEDVEEVTEDLKNKGEEMVEEAKDKIESYKNMTKEELRKRAKEFDIDKYTEMDKEELIEALKGRE